jgi:3-oxoacyl-(acyl-carrier-protein) synthase
MNPTSASPPVSITGLAMASALGESPAAHRAAIDAGRHGLRPLHEFPEGGFAGTDLLAGWIDNRGWLSGRRYGGASNAAVRIAKQAVADAGWSAADLVDTWLFSGTSRGNTGELFQQWDDRRPMPVFAASSSMHSELAAAVSIELGIRGPWQTLSNGCASGLDALGFAAMAVASGAAPRALVVSVDLPLVPALVRTFRQTGLLSHNNTIDPYGPDTSGFHPAEACAALAIEPATPDRSHPELLAYAANSDAHSSVALPEDGQPLAALLEQLVSRLAPATIIKGICPHASGTAAHGASEHRSIRTWASARPAPSVGLHFMKPFSGHALGASGALDAAVLALYLRDGLLPPNLPGLTPLEPPLAAPATPMPIGADEVVIKVAVGMGGHNATVALRPPGSGA